MSDQNIPANLNGGGMTADFAQQLLSGIAEVRATSALKDGRPYLRLLKDGSWVWGPEDVEVEKGSEWAINTMSLRHGWVCWNNTPNTKAQKLGEIMVSMTVRKPMCPDPINGQAFKEQRGFDAQCMSGEDTGQEVQYAAPSDGGLKAVDAVMGALQRHLASESGISTPFPIVRLGSTWYNHIQHGRIYKPVFEIVRWVGMDGNPAAAQATPVNGPGGAAGASASVRVADVADAPEPAKRQRRAAAAAPETVVPGPETTQQAHAGQRRRPASR